MENEDAQEVGGKTKVDVQDSATGESADKLREDSLATMEKHKQVQCVGPCMCINFALTL